MRVPGFRHRMAAHCESGAVTALLNHAGLAVSEPMVFGVAGAMFFGYFHNAMFPFPTFFLRTQPGRIRAAAARRLGVGFRCERFRDPARAEAALDARLDRGVPVGAQVDFFYMDYIPPYARAHFNAHYVTVVGRENGDYLVSDSYSPELARVSAGTLRTARFPRGPFAPRGMLFHPVEIPASVDWRAAIRAGIRQTAFRMLHVPIPIFGVRGIRYFARKLPDWPRYARDEDHLSHQVMMIHVILEERGTGGGGFRFLYAAFLQEAARLLGDPRLEEQAGVMMENGDRWRDISLFAARIGRDRDMGAARLGELGRLLRERADAEERIFRGLYALAKEKG